MANIVLTLRIFLILFEILQPVFGGPLHKTKRDILSSMSLEDDEDIMSRIALVNEESGVNLFESDIKVLDGEPNEDSTDEFGSKRNAIRARIYLWQEKKVPYVISSELDEKRYNGTILAAIDEFHSNTCIKFAPHTTQSNWINFVHKSGCWSSVGRRYWRAGGQELSLGPGCNNRGTIQHELLHALGFWHEQSRPDRNQYIEVLWENIVPGKEHNFLKYDRFKLDDQKKLYDVQSIMHYGKRYFSKNGEPTILSVIHPSLPLGQRNGFSMLDIDEVNQLYDCKADLFGWSSWSSFTPCDKACNKKRERFCTSSNPNEDCPGDKYYGVQKETAVCSITECHAQVDGHWGRWSSWGNCSSSCGPGNRIRTRLCDDPKPANDGSYCVGDNQQPIACVTQSCGLGPDDSEFESGVGMWHQDVNEKLDWQYNKGTTMSAGTGPTGDHTSGSGGYLYLEASSPAKAGDTATLISRTFRGSNSTICFIISYNMNGRGMGSLKIYLKTSTDQRLLATTSGNQGDTWNTLHVDVQSSSEYQVVIEGVRGNTYTSDIAIDDIFFIPGSCSETPMRNLGCYKDNTRPLSNLYENLRSSIDWNDMRKTVLGCAHAAKKKGYKIFSVEFYGECWSSSDAKDVYNKDGGSDQCKSGVGQHWTYQAYELL